MNAVRPNLRTAVVLAFLFVSSAAMAQNFSAGVNTETPNPRAVLHLVSPNGDQGLLIPQLTTAQRTAMASSLNAQSNGLLVYDNQQGLFYFWLNSGWIALSVSDSQSISLTGTQLAIQNGNSVDLASLGYLTAETDPTVPANIKDGISWTELSDIPAGFADGTDDGGIASVVTDGTTITGNGAGEILKVGVINADQVNGLSAVAKTGSFNDLVDLPANIDTDKTDDLTSAASPAAGDVSGSYAGGLLVEKVGGQTATAIGAAVSLVNSNPNIDLDGTNDLTAVTTNGTLTGSGTTATPLAVNTGIGPNQVVQLNGSAQLPAVDGSLLTGVTASVAPGSITNTEMAPNSVQSGNITDGSIVDADISGTAAISATKLQSTVMLETENVSLLNNDAGYVASGDNISVFTNDAGYVGSGANVSVLINDAGYIVSGDNVSTLTNDAGYIGSGDNVSVLVNDAGYVVSGDNVSTFTNDAGYLATVTTNATLTGDGTAGTPLAVNAGTGPSQIVQLNGSAQLPAVDGSQLTNVAVTLAGDVTGTQAATTIAANAVTSAKILDGTITDVDVATGAGIAGSKVVPNFGAQNISTTGTMAAASYTGDGTALTGKLSTVTTNATLTGDGTAGIPLAVNVGTGAGQIVQLDGLAQLPAVDGSQLTNVTAANFTGALAGDVTGTQSTTVVNNVNLSAISGAGASPNYILEYNGTNWAPVAPRFDYHLSFSAPADGYVLTWDNANSRWDALAPSGLTLPFADNTSSTTAPTALFDLENQGSGPAAKFGSVTDAVAVEIKGDIAFNSLFNRKIGILDNASGNGNDLDIKAGNSTFAGGSGGGLYLRSGDGSGGGNGGNIFIEPGLGAANGGIDMRGVTRFSRQGAPGRIELDDNGGGILGIQAPGAITSYTITMPSAQGAGVLTNDGAGLLTWSPGGFTSVFSDDGNNVVFGSPTPVFTVTNPSFQLGVAAAGPGGKALLAASSFQNSSTLELTRANGSQGGESPLAATEVVGDILFTGFDGAYNPAARIKAIATQAWGPGLTGTALSFEATKLNDGTPFEMMRLEDGILTVTNENGNATVDAVSYNPTLGSQLNMVSANGSIGTPTAINLGDNLGDINFVGNYGGPLNFIEGARIRASATEGWGAGRGTELRLSTTPAGNVGVVDQVIIRDNGNVEMFGSGALRVHSGTNLQRPVGPTPGMLRYNTDISAFEGYNGAWTPLGGGGAFIVDGFNNHRGGSTAGTALSTGIDNVIIGGTSGGGITTASANVVIGQNANSDNTSNNVAVGPSANAAGGQSVAIGAGAQANAGQSIALGQGTIANNANTAIIGSGGGSWFDVGISTSAPNGRLEVAVVAGETKPGIVVNHQGASGPGISVAQQNASGAGMAINLSASANNNDGLIVDNGGSARAATFRNLNVASVSSTVLVESNSPSNALQINQLANGNGMVINHTTTTTGTGLTIDMNAGGTDPAIWINNAPTSGAILADGNIITTAAINAQSTSITGAAVLQGPVITPSIGDGAVNTLATPTSRVIRLTAGSGNINNIAAGQDGQELILVKGPAGVLTITVAGNIRLNSASNFAMDANDTLHLIYDLASGFWLEIGRSVN